MHALISDILLLSPLSAEDKPSQVLEPPRHAARAVLILGAATPAHPVLPPDPFQVIDLDHDQRDDRDEQLSAAHGASLSDPPETRKFERIAASRSAATRSGFRSDQGQYQ